MVWKKTISAKALEKAGYTSVKVGNEIVFISNVEQELFAMDGTCSHAKCVLGHLEKTSLKVRCQCHDAVFELKTGKMVEPPYVAPNAPMDKLGLRTYPVRDNNGFIEVDLPQE